MTNNKKLSRQEMIDAIYEKIARKDLSFGCRIILENQEIIMETNPYEGHYSEYYEANGVITGRCGTETTEGTTLQIEKIYFYEKFYNEKEVSDAFAEEFVFDEEYEKENKNLTIIGHPVMIGDVMDFIERNFPDGIHCIECKKGKILSDNFNDDTIFYCDNEDCEFLSKFYGDEAFCHKMELYDGFWEEKRKPIEEQSDDCIEFVYDLISE